MQNIVVGFSRPKNWFEPFSWIIRLAYWSSYSHAYIRYDSEEFDTSFVIQASGLKINLIEQSLFDSKEVIYREFILPITADKRKKMLVFAMAQLGEPYSITGILGMVWVRIGQLLGLKNKSPFKYNGTSAFCSELVAYILENYENVDFDENPADLAPKDVFNMLAKVYDKQ